MEAEEGSFSRNISYTYKFVVRKILYESNTFIKQGHI